MLKHLLFAFIFPLTVIPNAFSQNSVFCGSDLVEQELSSMNVNYYSEVHAHDYLVKRLILEEREKAASRDLDTAILTIPMVFHILYLDQSENLSDSKIYTEIDNINEAFRNLGYYDPSIGADVRIQFCLAKVAPDGTGTSGIEHIMTPLTDIGQEDDFIMKQQFNWDPSQYLNVYIARNLLGGNVLGYAYDPTSHGEFWDGIVLLTSIVGRSKANSAVFAHEIGHYLGLPHPFDRGCKNDDCLIDGDRVCDTPPDNSTFEGCHAFNSCTTDTDDPSANNPFTTDNNDMNNLYMDYTDGDCRNAFTDGQAERMRIVLQNIRASLLNSTVCQVPSAFDAGVTDIVQPVITECEPDITLGIEIRNFGLAPLTQANITYQIDQLPLVQGSWTGNIPYTGKDTFYLPTSTNIAPGPHTITVFTSMPNGQPDGFAVNDTTRITFNYQPFLTAPFLEDFSSGIPSNWSMINPIGLGWRIVDKGCDDGSGTNCLFMDNTITAISGFTDAIVTPVIDLRYVQDGYLIFDRAFAFDSNTVGRRENFEIRYSIDCGKTFEDTLLYNRSRRNLATTFISVDSFDTWAPESCADWSKDSIDVSFLRGNEVVFRFDLEKFDNGFPIYLDNIQIEGSFNTKADPLLNTSVEVFPNPASGSFTVNLELEKPEEVWFRMLDLHGKNVYTAQRNSHSARMSEQFQVQSLASGVYFLEIRTRENLWVKKLVIE